MCRKNNRALIICKLVLPLILIISSIFLVKIVIVSGTSMEPTYKDGTVLIMSRIVGSIDKNDIIVFEYNDELYVKRVLATPGDNIELKNNYVYLNGAKQINIPYIGEEYSCELSQNEYFVIGDNCKNSIDSRDFGPVNIKAIKYKGW